MEKIKLTDNSEFDLVTNGIFPSEEALTVTILKEESTLTGLYDVFSDPAKTKRIILLSSGGEELAVYGDYTILQTITLNTEEDAVTIGLKKPNEIGLRLASVEAQVTDAQEALCDLYEMIIG